MNRSKSVRQTFGSVEGDDLESNKSFMRLTHVVEAFFHRLIVTNELEQNAVEQACIQLGKRHMTYSEAGFQAIFWDVFLVKSKGRHYILRFLFLKPREGF